MTVGELSALWNDLRNAALGRGVKPLVSAPLAARIGSEWDAWRAYYEQQAGPLQDLDLPTSTLEGDWVDRYRALADAVGKEGIYVKGLPLDPIEKTVAPVKAAAQAGLDVLGEGLKTVLVAAAIIIPAGLALMLYRGSR